MRVPSHHDSKSGPHAWPAHRCQDGARRHLTALQTPARPLPGQLHRAVRFGLSRNFAPRSRPLARGENSRRQGLNSNLDLRYRRRGGEWIVASARGWPVLYNAPFTRAGTAALQFQPPPARAGYSGLRRRQLCPRARKRRAARARLRTPRRSKPTPTVRVAKQVGAEVESSRRKSNGTQERDGKG